MFGLEVLDVLLLFPGLWVCGILFERPILGAIVTVASAVTIRLLKWGRLPGYTRHLAIYLLFGEYSGTAGTDPAPPYPTGGSA